MLQDTKIKAIIYNSGLGALTDTLHEWTLHLAPGMVFQNTSHSAEKIKDIMKIIRGNNLFKEEERGKNLSEEESDNLIKEFISKCENMEKSPYCEATSFDRLKALETMFDILRYLPTKKFTKELLSVLKLMSHEASVYNKWYTSEHNSCWRKMAEMNPELSIDLSKTLF